MIRMAAGWTVIALTILMQGCGNGVSPGSSSIKMYDIKDGVYLRNVVWQDTWDNTHVSTDFQGAVKYCRNLRLYGSDKWRLPSGAEASMLDRRSEGFFKHLAHDTYYHTGSVQNEGLCKQAESEESKSAFMKAYEAPFDLLSGALGAMGDALKSQPSASRPMMSCRYKLDKYYNIWYQKMPLSKSSLVRCVLDADDYKEAYRKVQRTIAALRAQGTYEGYLKAFELSREIDDIERAYALAKTDKERLRAEMLMVKMIPDKLFDVTLQDMSGHDVNLRASGTTGTIVDTTSRKHIRSRITVKSDFLKYGTYNVYVKLTLKTVYRRNSHLAMLSTSHLSEQESYKTVEFVLSPDNGYKATKEVDFGKIVAHSMTSAGIVGGSYELVDMKIRAEIAGAKPL